MKRIFLTRMAGAVVVVAMVFGTSAQVSYATQHRAKRSHDRIDSLSFVNHEGFKLLSHKNQVALIKAYWDFFTSYEKSANTLRVSSHASVQEKAAAEAELIKLQQLFALVRNAQAAQDPQDDASTAGIDQAGLDPDFNCFYAGWPSVAKTYDVDGKQTQLCESPAKGNPEYTDPSKACQAGELLCQPALFGDGLCVPQATQQERNSSFRDCGRKFRATGRSLDKLVEQIAKDPDGLGELLDQMNSVAQDICVTDTTTLQNKNPMCTSLIDRVGKVYAGVQKLVQPAPTEDPNNLPDPSSQKPGHPHHDRAIRIGTQSPTPSRDSSLTTSDIDLPTAIACYHAVDQLFPAPSDYPQNMAAVPGKSQDHVGALVFTADDKSPKGKTSFCPGLVPQKGGIYFDVFAADEHGDLGKAGLSQLAQCTDLDVDPATKVYLGFFISMKIRSLVQYASLSSVRLTDDQVKRTWLYENGSQPTANDLAAFRKYLESEIKKFANHTQAALQLCSKVTGDSNFSQMVQLEMQQLTSPSLPEQNSASCTPPVNGAPTTPEVVNQCGPAIQAIGGQTPPKASGQ